MDKQFHPTFCWARDYLSMLGLKLLHCPWLVRLRSCALWERSLVSKFLSPNGYVPLITGEVLYSEWNQTVPRHVPVCFRPHHWIFAMPYARSNFTWWRHDMETFSALLTMCAGNPPVAGEFPAQRSVTRSFDVTCDLRLNKRLSKQSRGWWFETLPRLLWRHCNEKELPAYRPRSFYTMPTDGIRSQIIISWITPRSSRFETVFIQNILWVILFFIWVITLIHADSLHSWTKSNLNCLHLHLI